MRNSPSLPLIACAALVVALFVTESTAAQVYRWVDKDGKVHYSDKKPPDTKADELAISSKPSDPLAAEKVMAELTAANAGIDEAGKAHQQQQAELAKAKELREKRCASARAELQTLASVNRAYTVDAQGERVYDNDAQLEGRRAQARAQVAQLCE